MPKRLEAMDLVSPPFGGRRRRVLAPLTEKGVALRADAAAVLRCIGEAIGMSATEIARLTNEIRALRGALDRAAEALSPKPI